MILPGSTPRDWTSWISVWRGKMPTVSKKKYQFKNTSCQCNFRELCTVLFGEHLAQWKFSNTHLACTVEASSQGCQCHNNSPAVIAFDRIEGSDTRQGPHPAQVFLQDISQITDVKGIPVVLWPSGWKMGQKVFLKSSPVTKTSPKVEYYMIYCK